MKKPLHKPILLLLWAFMAHNIEEALYWESWPKSPYFPHFQRVSPEQFSFAVALFTILGCIVIFAENYYKTQRQFLLITTGFAGMIFLNVFFPHLLVSFLFWRYVPGVMTAVCINLPLTSAILWLTYRKHLLQLNEILIASFIGGLVGIALIFIFLQVGELLAAYTI